MFFRAYKEWRAQPLRCEVPNTRRVRHEMNLYYLMFLRRTVSYEVRQTDIGS